MKRVLTSHISCLLAFRSHYFGSIYLLIVMPYIRYTYQYISGAKLSGRRARNLPILMNTGLTEYEIVFVLQTHLQNQVF
jgi:hypothetical protein